MKNKFFHIVVISLCVCGCALPQFSFKPGGGNGEEIDANTVQVDFFENNSTIGGAFLSASFTESLRDIMQAQTKLELVDSKGDIQITGVISNYLVSPINIQAQSESAAQNRLKMNVSVSTYFKNNDSIGLNNSPFSAFVDYDASRDFTSIEEQLVEELNFQLTQDIYDKIFGGEW